VQSPQGQGSRAAGAYPRRALPPLTTMEGRWSTVTLVTAPTTEMNEMSVADVLARIQAMASSLAAAITGTGAPLVVRAVFLQKRRVFGTYVAVTIGDANTGTTMEAAVPSRLVSRLRTGTTYVFAGTLRVSLVRGALFPTLMVSRVIRVESTPSEDPMEIIRNLAEKARHRSRDIEALLLESPSPTVLAVGTSTAIQDIFTQMGETLDEIAVRHCPVNVESPEAVASALRKASREPVDLIALVRGGGDSVRLLDSVPVAEAIASSPVPIVVACGHATDELMIARVAAREFSTPTALGAFLAQVAARRIGRRVEIESLRAELARRDEAIEGLRTSMTQLQEQLESALSHAGGLRDELRRKNETLTRALRIWIPTAILAGVAAGVVITILMSRL